jgi:hypothetical protein
MVQEMVALFLERTVYLGPVCMRQCAHRVVRRSIMVASRYGAVHTRGVAPPVVRDMVLPHVHLQRAMQAAAWLTRYGGPPPAP